MYKYLSIKMIYLKKCSHQIKPEKDKKDQRTKQKVLGKSWPVSNIHKDKLLIFCQRY